MEEVKDKKIYELALLLKSDDDAARAVEWIKQYNGEAVSEPRAKKLALAYKIKGNTEAVFVSMLFRMIPDDAKQLERDLRMRGEVIRSMVLVAAPAEPQREFAAPPFFPSQRRGRPLPETREPRPIAPRPLSNEALEKKIEEILQ